MNARALGLVLFALGAGCTEHRTEKSVPPADAATAKDPLEWHPTPKVIKSLATAAPPAGASAKADAGPSDAAVPGEPRDAAAPAPSSSVKKSDAGK